MDGKQKSSQLWESARLQMVLRFSAVTLAVAVCLLLLNLDFSRLGERAGAQSGTQVTTTGGTAHYIAKWVVSSAPEADIRANDLGGSITIPYGASATITWCGPRPITPSSICENTTSCSVSPSGWAGTSGEQSTGSLTASRTYTLTCQGPGGTAVDDVTVNIQISGLSASCSVSPTSATIGQNVTWTASASGGVGSYAYTWEGSAPLAGRTGNPVSVSYSSAGTKTGRVTVVSGGDSITVDCSNSVTIGAIPPPT